MIEFRTVTGVIVTREDHLRASMTRLYAPEQMTRRRKEIECQLPQNMADPNRQIGLECLELPRFAN